MKLLIGTKNYSTWSLRPWLLMRHLDLPFEEEILPLYGEGWKKNYWQRTPNGMVPVLEVDGIAIGETLAIIETLAEKLPHKNVWPQDPNERAMARAMASEMHAGFSDLRSRAPMNLRAHFPNRIDLDFVGKDLKRLEKLLGEQLERSGGPFLFGDFCAADAMFAPVAMRILTYDLPVSDLLMNWVRTIDGMDAMQQWRTEALLDDGIVPMDEIDMMDQ